ncbi:MAG TPA: VCBS repeat-containing protein, partial [Polyangiaceae bacterium]
GGAALTTGKCLPAPPVCAADAGVPDGGALTCLEKCEYHPPSSAFAPALAYAWGGDVTSPFSSDVMMAPIVVPLEDTNCDGKVDQRDIPDIVFTSFTGGAYTSNGTLHAIAVRGGKLVDRWSVPGTTNPAASIAGGDVDGNPGNEVVACGTDGAVHAYHGNGAPFWTSAAITCEFPQLADLNGDGKVEVVVEGGILDGATGATKVAKAFGTFAISDIDGDGILDIVSSSQGFHADGTLFVDTSTPGDWPAIGDFDRDGKPEIVAVHYSTHTVSFWHYDAAAAQKFDWVRQGVDINGTLTQHCPAGSAGFTAGGGPPTVADFNGDGTPDVALAGGIGYAVLNGAKVIDSTVANAATLLWAASTTDCSSAATGSSIFDFTGSGTAEVLYSDEEHLRVYDGPTGNVLFSTCNTTGTLEEFPLVADVDNDGHADIVVVSNAYASGNAEYQCNDGTNIAQSGVRVFSDPNLAWVRTRAIWNEHPYHVTNVNDDGTIPQHELPNWTQPGLNNFRQNKQPGGEFAAPDAIVSLAPVCTSPFGLAATVRNIGEAALPAGVVVGFYSGTAPGGTKLGSLSTLLPLYPAESETLVLTLTSPPAGIVNGTTPVYAVVDDTTTPHPGWHECRTDNDTSADVAVVCHGSN